MRIRGAAKKENKGKKKKDEEDSLYEELRSDRVRRGNKKGETPSPSSKAYDLQGQKRQGRQQRKSSASMDDDAGTDQVDSYIAGVVENTIPIYNKTAADSGMKQLYHHGKARAMLDVLPTRPFAAFIHMLLGLQMKCKKEENSYVQHFDYVESIPLFYLHHFNKNVFFTHLSMHFCNTKALPMFDSHKHETHHQFHVCF